MRVNNIREITESFFAKTQSKDRYTSFDYCYNYFYKSQSLNNDMEKSCLVLGFYLASWGMFRNSFLMQKSVKYYQPVIEYIASLEKNIWDIDIDSFSDENIEKIIKIYKDIKELIIEDNNSDLILVTKILLGVFGFVPAFDNYFTNTFRRLSEGECGFRSMNKKSLKCISKFYESNKLIIDEISSSAYTTDFKTGLKTKIRYPKAKIIDMYGFTVGLRIDEP